MGLLYLYLPVGAVLFHADGRTGKMKLIFSFHNFAIAPKNHKKSHELRLIRPQTNTKFQNMYLKFIRLLT